MSIPGTGCLEKGAAIIREDACGGAPSRTSERVPGGRGPQAGPRRPVKSLSASGHTNRTRLSPENCRANRAHASAPKQRQRKESSAKLFSIRNVVSVAQPVEHRSVEPRVVGSNPIAHPSYPTEYTGLHPPMRAQLGATTPPLFRLRSSANLRSRASKLRA
jgi:hypothetical protein